MITNVEIFLFLSIVWLIESSEEQYLFEISNVCNIINAFSVTFEQCDVSLHDTHSTSVNKWINTDPNLVNDHVCCIK